MSTKSLGLQLDLPEHLLESSGGALTRQSQEGKNHQTIFGRQTFYFFLSVKFTAAHVCRRIYEAGE